MRKLVVIISLLALAGCYNDKADQLYPKAPASSCDTMNITFKADIQPILTKSCALSGCHDAATPSFGYNYEGYAGAKLSVDNKRLLGSIRHEANFNLMPKNAPKLDDCAINKITRWVNLGAKND